MRAQPLGAVLTLSIDLPPLGEETAITARIQKLLADAEIRATWFSDKPGRDSTLGRVLADGRGDEAALRISDAAGCQPPNGEMDRPTIFAEISRRKAEAQQAGIAISSLSIPEAATVPAERLVKFGITAVRSLADSDPTRDGDAGFVAVRFGLWRTTPELVYHGGNGFGDWRNRLQICRAINRCIRNRQPLYLAIDAVALSRISASTQLSSLASIVRHICRGERAGVLEICTIAETISRLAAPQSNRSAASILRAA